MLLRRYHKKEESVEDAVIEEKEEVVEEEVNLNDLKLKELKDIAEEKGIEGYSDMKKDELIEVLKKGD